MVHFFSKNRRVLWIGFILLLLLLAFNASTFGMHYYEKLDFVTGLVTASALNVRAGPRNEL